MKILGLFIFLSFVTRGLFLGIDILDIDEAAHIVGSWELMRGNLLYTDFVDNKPPLLYVYYAFAQTLFGKGMFSVHFLTALVTVPFTALAISAFFDHDRRGIIAGLVFLIYSGAFLAHDMLAANAEILMMLPASWALALLRSELKARSMLPVALSAVLLGISVLLKYQIIFWVPAIAIAIIFACMQRKEIARIRVLALCWIAGFSLPLFITYLYFHHRHGTEALIYWTIQHNIRYTGNPISFSEAFGRGASYLLPFLIVTAFLWYGFIRSIKLFESRFQALLLSALMICTFPAAFLGFRFFPHYFIQFYVPLSLASAPYIVSILQPPLRRIGKVFIIYTFAFLVGFWIGNSILYFGPEPIYRERNPVFREVAWKLRKDPCYSNGGLFVWGYAPMFYYYSELQPASRFAVLATSGLTEYISGNLGRQPSNSNFVIPKSWDLLMEDLTKNRPTYIIDTAPAGIFRWDRYPIEKYPKLEGFLRADYEPAGVIHSVRIYRRKSCS